MNRTAHRLAATITCVAASTLAAPLTRTQSTAEANVATSTSNGSGMNNGNGGGFNDFMGSYVWGRNVITLGWFYIRPMDSATPLTTTTSVLGLGAHQSPGTDVKVNGANMLSLTFTHFLNGNIAGTFVGGVPSKLNLYGSGNVIAPVPVVGPLALANLGLPQNNPVATVHE